jgi:hypothetical protein
MSCKFSKEISFNLDRVITRIDKTVNGGMINLSILSGEDRVVEFLFPSELRGTTLREDLFERILGERALSLLAVETNGYLSSDSIRRVTIEFSLHTRGKFFDFLTVEKDFRTILGEDYDEEDRSLVLNVGSNSCKFW